METTLYSTINAFSRDSRHNTIVDDNFGRASIDFPVPMPTECPCCKIAMAHDLIPIIAVNNLSPSDIKDKDHAFRVGSECIVTSIYRCTSCNSLFTLWSKHKFKHDEDNKFRWSCDIQNQYPFNTHVTIFSDEIKQLSPEFVDCYNQSELAESQSLNKLCGMGYRRALEFLVDSYVRKIKPTEDINPDLKLGMKINNYIDDERIKTLAQKSAWLGNDATHIVNKHPNRDIVADMKKFIKAMTTMIDAQFAFEDANNM